MTIETAFSQRAGAVMAAGAWRGSGFQGRGAILADLLEATGVTISMPLALCVWAGRRMLPRPLIATTGPMRSQS